MYTLILHQSRPSAIAYLFCNRDGCLAGRAEMEIRQFYPQAGWHEQDPLALWARMHKAVRIVREEAGVRPGEIVAIGLLGQRGLVAWDAERDRPLCQALVGDDPRRCAWLLTSVPAVRTAAERGHLRLGTPATWLLWNLTGIYRADEENATCLGPWTPAGGWDTTWLHSLGLSATALPQVQASRETAGWGVTSAEGPVQAVAPVRAMRLETAGRPAWENIRLLWAQLMGFY